MRTIRSAWRAAASGALGLGHPPAGLAPEHQHGVGVRTGQPVEGGDERSHPLARLERADEDHQRPVGRHTERTQHAPGPPRRRARAGENRRWSTPCGRDDDAAPAPRSSPVSRSAVTWLTQISTPAWSAARRMARRKKAALERRCHSGWSKKVQSWIVTAHGTGDRAGIV